MATYKKRETRKDTRTGFKRKDRDMDFMPVRKKFCRFCVEKASEIDYKDAKRLEKFVTERYKMISRKFSGNCTKHQRKLSSAIKLARYMALLPYVRT